MITPQNQTGRREGQLVLLGQSTRLQYVASQGQDVGFLSGGAIWFTRI